MICHCLKWVIKGTNKRVQTKFAWTGNDDYCLGNYLVKYKSSIIRFEVVNFENERPNCFVMHSLAKWIPKLFSDHQSLEYDISHQIKYMIYSLKKIIFLT